uniref:Uncharacterized protein n=1 Tax=Anguilla anguilla TaxID=7936 RepID=A0A0E9TF73_ANGAN
MHSPSSQPKRDVFPDLE